MYLELYSHYEDIMTIEQFNTEYFTYIEIQYRAFNTFEEYIEYVADIIMEDLEPIFILKN